MVLLCLSDYQWLERTANAPHRGHDALETGEKQCGCEVNRLVWLLLVALCGFTGAEEGEKRILQVELHELLDSKDSIIKA
jgi:hypothetical protein